MMPITSRLVMVAASIEQVLGNPVGVHGANYCEDTDKRIYFLCGKGNKDCNKTALCQVGPGFDMQLELCVVQIAFPITGKGDNTKPDASGCP